MLNVISILEVAHLVYDVGKIEIRYVQCPAEEVHIIRVKILDVDVLSEAYTCRGTPHAAATGNPEPLWPDFRRGNENKIFGLELGPSSELIQSLSDDRLPGMVHQ
jgi:hypothetical protein